MHKKTLVTIMAILAATFMLSDAAFAKCGMCKGEEGHKNKGKIVNKTCPVMGGRVKSDTPHKVEYKGNKIGLCCASCVEEFNKNPEKYAAKLKLDKIVNENLIDEKHIEALQEKKEKEAVRLR